MDVDTEKLKKNIALSKKSRAVSPYLGEVINGFVGIYTSSNKMLDEDDKGNITLRIMEHMRKVFMRKKKFNVKKYDARQVLSRLKQIVRFSVYDYVKETIAKKKSEIEEVELTNYLELKHYEEPIQDVLVDFHDTIRVNGDRIEMYDI